MFKKINSVQRIVFLIALSVVHFFVHAQSRGEKSRKAMPNIPGFYTLQCDFHMHTVFSDGHVWPSFRVYEAERDGLDAISLTEHIDYEGYPDEIKRDKNKSYEIGLASVKKNLMLVQGVEISPRVPPYHCNVLFLKDPNRLTYGYMKTTGKKFVMKDSIAHDELMAPFLEAENQKAFVFYNHPGYSWWDKKDTAIFTKFHQELFDKKILKGVELANSGRYNIIAHRMAMKYGLTMISNSDEHYDMSNRYPDSNRPRTLVFTKSRTVEAIHEALDAGRTIAYFGNFLVGRKPEIESFFKACIDASVQRQTRNGERILTIKFYNKSDIDFNVRAFSEYDIEDKPLGQAIVKAKDTTAFILKTVWKYPDYTTLKLQVSNMLVSPEEPLTTEFKLSTLPTDPLASLKVMSYNIHHANPPSRPDFIDLDAIAKVINNAKPDLVAVQEVDVHTRRSGSSLNEAEELGVKTGMQVYFAKAIDHDGGDYGVAILSRFPLTAGITYPLPVIEGTKGEPRVLATVQIQLPGDQKVVFACTHLDAQRPDSNRVIQMKEIVKILRKETYPVIIAGDLNAVAGGEVINTLDQYFTRTCKKNCGFTIPVDKPTKTIDFIAYSTDDPVKIISHKVIDEKYASDHLPVIAELQLK